MAGHLKEACERAKGTGPFYMAQQTGVRYTWHTQAATAYWGMRLSVCSYRRRVPSLPDPAGSNPQPDAGCAAAALIAGQHRGGTALPRRRGSVSSRSGPFLSCTLAGAGARNLPREVVQKSDGRPHLLSTTQRPAPPIDLKNHYLIHYCSLAPQWQRLMLLFLSSSSFSFLPPFLPSYPRPNLPTYLSCFLPSYVHGSAVLRLR